MSPLRLPVDSPRGGNETLPVLSNEALERETSAEEESELTPMIWKGALLTSGFLIYFYGLLQLGIMWHGGVR